MTFLEQKPKELLSKVNKFGINLKLCSTAIISSTPSAFSFIRLAARPPKTSAPVLVNFYPQGRRGNTAETKNRGVVPKPTKNPQCVLANTTYRRIVGSTPDKEQSSKPPTKMRPSSSKGNTFVTQSKDGPQVNTAPIITCPLCSDQHRLSFIQTVPFFWL